MPRYDLHKRILLEAAAMYWQSYASVGEAETAALRRWSAETLSRNMIERAVMLCDACAQVESGRRAPAGENTRDGNLVRIVGCRDWNGIRLSIFGLDSEADELPASFQRQVRDATLDSLPLCVLPSSYIEGWQDFASEIRTDGRFVFPLFPTDVNALARGRWSLLDLIEYKLHRLVLLDKLDVETQYGELLFGEFAQETRRRRPSLFTPLAKVIEQLRDKPSNWAEHPMLDRLVKLLRDGRDCLLVGPSSSGKSILAFEAGLRLVQTGMHVDFVDVGSVSPYVAARTLSHLRTLLRSDQDTLLVIDDLQSSPSVARYLFAVKSLLSQADSVGRIVVLAITWPSYAKEAAAELSGPTRISVEPSDARRALLAKYGRTRTTTDISTLSEIAGDDVLLWRLLLETPRWERPSKAALASKVWERRVNGYRGDVAALKRAVLVAALLGRYEFELSEGFLEYQAAVSKSTIEAMVKARILRRTMDKLVLGHRSVCALLAGWLAADGQVWTDLHRLEKPVQPIEIVNAYIRAADVSEVWAILKTLHMQVGFKGDQAITQRAQVLADAWKSIDSLAERVEQQQMIDPTWGENLASALFAIEALCAVGKQQKAKASIDFMRSCWSLVDNSLEIHPGTADRLDFDEIRRCMEEEDEVVGAPAPPRDPATKVDSSRFHSTWAKGLVLCAEGAYRERSNQELQELAIAVEGGQAADGHFYPRRVPWVTARVLMGLARCGRSYDRSDAVRKACEWLLRPSEQGGVYQQGVWESGTGAWNTPLETTSMCIIALVLAGMPPNDSRIAAAWDYIVSERADWTRPEREIDGANAIWAYMTVVGNWQDIIPEVQFLLKWARGEAFWDSATRTAKESLDQSSRVAVVADYLIDAAWSSLRTDLPEFLEAFAVTPLRAEEFVSTETQPVGRSLRIDRLREQTAAKILLEFENRSAQLRAQLRELRAYEQRLAEEQQVPINLDELESRRAAILREIRDLVSRHDATVVQLQQATSERAIKEIYEGWQDALKE